MELETDGEKLIFPNLSAMRIKFSLKEGSTTNQVINKVDDDIEINLIIDKVVLRLIEHICLLKNICFNYYFVFFSFKRYLCDRFYSDYNI